MPYPHKREIVLSSALALITLMGCAAPQSPVDASAPWADTRIQSRIVEPTDDPGQLVPADARLYIRADDLATWRSEVGEDPILAQLWRVTDDMRAGSGWEAAQKKLGLTQEQMQETYLGETFCVVEQKHNDQRGLVVMSRSKGADLERLRDALSLKLDETIGPFRLFITPPDENQKRYLFAFGKRWFLLAEEAHRNHMRRLLSAVAHRQVEPDKGAASISSAEGRPKKLLAKIPADHAMLILTRNGDGTERHAAAIVRDGKKVVTHYAATVPSLKKMSKRFEWGTGVDFGLLPDSTITAATINVTDPKPDGIGVLDFLIAPRSMERDVLPKLEAPMMLFLAQVPSDQIEPNPIPDGSRVLVPVVGMALKLKDHSVTSDLDLLVMRTHLVANLVELDLIKTFFGIRIVKDGDIEFKVADFGLAISRRVKDPKMAALLKLPSSAGLTRLSFGRIGDWYVICSQEKFFRQCVEAYSTSEKRLVATKDYEQFTFESQPKQLAAIITRADKLTAMLKSVESFWERFTKTHKVDAPQKPESSKVPEPDNSLEPEVGGEAKKPKKSRNGQGRYPKRDAAPSPLKWISDGLEKRQSFALQLWQDSDGDLIGRLLLAPIKESVKE